MSPAQALARPLPLTLPTPLRPVSLPAVGRHGRTLLAALCAVLLAHWLVLGQPLAWPLAWTQPEDARTEETPHVPTLQTRAIASRPAPPATARPAVAQTVPAARPRARPPQPSLPATPQRAQGDAPPPGPDQDTPAEPLAAATLPDALALALASKQALAPTDSAQAAINTIANDAPPEARPLRFSFATPVRLNYDVQALVGGNKNFAGAHIVWTHDGTNYQASLLVTKFMLHMRQWTSKGVLTEAGLAPLRFGDKGRGSEVAAHFVRDAGKVVFSANTPDVPLQPGAQDHLSVFMQLASIWAAEPLRFAAGDSIAFQSIGPRHAEAWAFVVSAEERITVPGGTLNAIKLTRAATGDYSTQAEVWLAPQLAYLPAHIRLTESNGDVLDMLWTDSEKP